MTNFIYFIIDENDEIYFYSHHLLSKFSINLMLKYFTKKYPNKNFKSYKLDISLFLTNFEIDKYFWFEYE